MGATFTTILKILYFGTKENLSIVVTFPTSGDVKDYVVSKFDPVVESSPQLAQLVLKDPFSRRSVFSTILKRIGGSHYFFRGSFVEHKAQSIDADILVVDELDFQKEEIRFMYEERLSGAGSKDMIYWLGTPTLPSWGISEIWEDSDQREWHIECPSCHKLQSLIFPESISWHKKTFICRFCRNDLSDDTRRQGIWIPKYPGREIHGYQINRLMAPWISAEKIIHSYHNERPKNFYNYALGLPFLEESQRYTKKEFLGILMSDNEASQFKPELKLCGIDQGNKFHLMAGIANSQEALVVKAKICDSLEDLRNTLRILNPDLIVMDMYPDQHFAKLLQNEYGGSKFIMANQRIWWDSRRLHEHLDFDREKGIANLERTESIDRMMDRLRNGSVRFLRSMGSLEEILTHLQNLIPDTEARFGRRRKIYKAVGKIDYASALNFLLIGCEISFPNYGIKPSRIVPSYSEPIITPGSKEWVEKEFERRIREISGNPGVVLIPPKKF